jgi:hypothetical protein
VIAGVDAGDHMTLADLPTLENVSMDRESILGRVWVHLIELSSNPDTIRYFYSALELRFFVEVLFFELLVRLANGDVSNRELKLYKPKVIAALLAELDPNFLATAGDAMAISITRDDLRRILALYGQLGRYLHLPKETFVQRDQERWKDDFEKLVIGAFRYFNELNGNTWPMDHAIESAHPAGSHVRAAADHPARRARRR